MYILTLLHTDVTHNIFEYLLLINSVSYTEENSWFVGKLTDNIGDRRYWNHANSRTQLNLGSHFWKAPWNLGIVIHRMLFISHWKSKNILKFILIYNWIYLKKTGILYINFYYVICVESNKLTKCLYMLSQPAGVTQILTPDGRSFQNECNKRTRYA